MFSPEPLPANAQVAVGLGTLAGSTVMLLTLAWGGSVLAGRCDLNEQVRQSHDAADAATYMVS